MVVDPNDACDDVVGDTVGAGHIASPDGAAQAVRNVIGNLNGFILGVEGYNAHDGAENLLSRHAHILVHVGENRRFQKISRSVLVA